MFVDHGTRKFLDRVSEPTAAPLAPSTATVIDRFRAAVSAVLTAHSLDRSFIEQEVTAITEHRLATTKDRIVLGIMNGFARLGAAYRSSNGANDLVALSLRLAETPCGPLYCRNVSPDRELAAFAAQRRS